MIKPQSRPWKNVKKKDISKMSTTTSNTSNTLDALDTARERGLLRFITAGSVDDGKSTLIGRLLFDSKGIFADQLDAMSRAKHKRTVGDTIDLSLLTDGLEAEREQGITIDVAYRYFATPKRKFIIADTPGHEQYTRNMVTGASTADAVIILIDVSKVKLGDDGSVELLTQTKRHSTIAHLLQIEHVVVAVNKMDLVNYDQTVYDRIVAEYQKFAAQLGLKDVKAIPLSALAGDNVVTRGDNLNWYQGPTLIELLESLSVYDECHDEPFRFPVQLVARHNGHEANDFRGYMGRIEAGKVSVGDQLVVQPSGQTATVKEILTLDGSLPFAVVGQSVTILLNEYLDISRGDMLASATRPATLLKTVKAEVCWLSEEPLDLRRRYWLKHTTKQVAAKVSAIDTLLDINTQERRPAESLKLNDIARVSINVQQALAADDYDNLRSTGAFILIDEVSHQTVAAGMIHLD
jgi:sulfate adenylyltransferase subunit 1